MQLSESLKKKSIYVASFSREYDLVILVCLLNIYASSTFRFYFLFVEYWREMNINCRNMVSEDSFTEP